MRFLHQNQHQGIKTMTKTIAITPANAAAIEAALAAVNGRASAHAFTSFEEVADLAASAEEAIADLNIPKTARAGAVWYQTSGAAVANAYKGTRQGTSVKLVRRTSGWHLEAAASATLYKEGGGAGRLHLTPTQRNEAVRRFEAGFSVQH